MNEILTNENVVETAEEVVETVNSCKGMKIAAGVGGAVILGAIAYKFIVKPIIAKVKAEKEMVDTEAETTDDTSEHSDETEE